MNISVVNEQWDIEAALVAGVPKKITTSAILKSVDEYGSGVVLFSKFKDAFQNKFGEFKKKPLTIELNPMPIADGVAEEDPAGKLWSIAIKSEALKEIQEVMHYGNPDMALQLELELTCRMYNATDRTYYEAESIDVKVEAEENDGISHGCYKKDAVEVKVPPSNGYNRIWTIALELNGRDFVCVADMLPKCSEAIRKIFTGKEFCDFEVVSGDGTVFPCHKTFLWAKSPVFEAMLNDKKFKEGLESKLVIEDMSTRGINALLEFLYCDEVDQALAYCDVAFELLKASDKYDIPLLWKVVARILVEKPHTWYTVDVALKLASFLVNCSHRQESERLKRRVVHVLTWKSKELANSAVYRELFPTDMSRGMFQLSLEAGMFGRLID